MIKKGDKVLFTVEGHDITGEVFEAVSDEYEMYNDKWVYVKGRRQPLQVSTLSKIS